MDQTEVIESLRLMVPLALIANAAAWYFGFFQMRPVRSSPNAPDFRMMLAGFTVVILLGGVLVLLLTLPLIAIEESGRRIVVTRLDAWVSVLSVTLVFVATVAFLFMLSRDSRQYLLTDNRRLNLSRVFKEITAGAGGFLVALPTMIVAHQGLTLLTDYLGLQVPYEQVAIVEIKQILPFPDAFAGMMVAICILVPISEEILFRGLFQTWLVSRVRRWLAMAVTCLFFASVHYSSSHGMGNIELIGTLFVLSLYIAILRERQPTLLAPIAMHAIFNCNAVLTMSYS